MKISTRLIIHTTCIAVVSVLFSSVLIGWLAHFSSKNSLEEQVKDRLISIRDIKAAHVQRYFDTILNQINTYANNYSIVEAMREFNSSFHSHSNELKLSDDSRSGFGKYRASIIKHYLENFTKEYSKLNGGLSINAKKLINVLDENSFALQYQYILQNPYRLENKSKFNYAEDGTSYSKAHKKYHPSIREFQESFDYHDIFLVDSKTGDIVYSVFKELDFTTSLINGQYANTAIGEVFRKANAATNKEFTVVSDFVSYLPSYGDQAAFAASPIFDEKNKKIGVLIFQMPVQVLNNIMTSYEKWHDVGLGDTGETYIIGDDFKLRSMSRFFIEDSDNYIKQMQNLGVNPQVLKLMELKQTSIGLQEVKTPGSSKVIKGETGFNIYQDYRGIWVLGAYEPLNIKGLNWAIMAEIDKDEAFKAVKKLGLTVALNTFIVMTIISIIAIFLGIWLSIRISLPIKRLSEIIRDLAKSQDLTKRIPVWSKDELGDMAQALNSLIESFQVAFKETIKSTEKMQMAAEKLIDISDDDDQEEDIKETGDSLVELSHRLQSLSNQFKIFEEEADKIKDW